MSYQTTIEQAKGYRQLTTAMAQEYVETPRMDRPESKEYYETVRAKAVRAVYSYWNQHQKAVDLYEIFRRVRMDIARDENWPKSWNWPSKRTVDRRVNESSDSRFYKGPTPTICLRPGVYICNPVCFEGKARVLLNALTHGSL